jgi:hypothetical protein
MKKVKRVENILLRKLKHKGSHASYIRRLLNVHQACTRADCYKKYKKEREEVGETHVNTCGKVL